MISQKIKKHLQVELLGQNKKLKVPKDNFLKLHISTDADMINSLAEFNIKIEDRVVDLYINEILSLLNKNLTEKLTEKIETTTTSVVNTIKYGSDKNILNKKLRKLKNKKEAFKIKPKSIITNGNLGTILQDTKDFKNDTLTTPKTGNLYQIGVYDGIPLWVNPMFRWDENLLILLYSDNFWNFSYDEEEDLSQVEKHTFPPLTIYHHFEEINYKTYKLQ